MDCCATTTTATDLAQLFAFGLLISAGHCVGMCGPLVCAVSSGTSTDRSGSLTSSIALHHAGRIASYAVLGLVLGSFSGIVIDVSTTQLWQSLLSFLAAAALLWTGLGLLGVFPLAGSAWFGRVSRFVADGARSMGGAGSGARRFGLGMANGLLPCGPVYTVAFAALASGGAGSGALALVSFGLGTVPLLVAVTLGVRWIGAKARLSMYRAAAVFALVMGVQLSMRGMAGLEWVPHARLFEVVLW